MIVAFRDSVTKTWWLCWNVKEEIIELEPMAGVDQLIGFRNGWFLWSDLKLHHNNVTITHASIGVAEYLERE